MKMKKLFSFILGTVLAITPFALTACGGAEANDGSDSLEINEEQSIRKMENLAKTQGYQFTLKYTQNNNSVQCEIGYKNNIFWILYNTPGKDVEGSAFLTKDNIIYCYEYENGKYAYFAQSESNEDNTIDNIRNEYSVWLYFGNTYDGYLKKGRDETVAGRSCYTYTCNPASLAGGIVGKAIGYNLDYKIAVDKELGITMKLEIVAKAAGEKASMSYEITSFKTGNAVTTPTLNEPLPLINSISSMPENVKIEFIDVSYAKKYIINKVDTKIYLQILEQDYNTEEYHHYADCYYEFVEQYNGYAGWERYYTYDYDLEQYVIEYEYDHDTDTYLYYKNGWSRIGYGGVYYRGLQLLNALGLGFTIDTSLYDATSENKTETVAGKTCNVYSYEDEEYDEKYTYYYSPELQMILKYVGDFEYYGQDIIEITNYTLNAGVIPTDLLIPYED